MKSHRFEKLMIALGASLLVGQALAHPFHGAGGGLAAGLSHPFLGFDHLLAMVAVGLWAARRGGRALWLAPAAFVGAMALGGLAGFVGATLPAGEHLVAGSVLALGLLLALPRTPALAAGVPLIALFGAFHGFAHASELPLQASAWRYAAGFLAATAALHAAGVMAGLRVTAASLRASGLPIALAGAWMLAGVAG
jgi:urease accessory protein